MTLSHDHSLFPEKPHRASWPREETVVKGVKNYATFFAVGKNRVGYKTVVSFDDRYMIAILGFVRFDGLWFLTESHVGFLDYLE